MAWAMLYIGGKGVLLGISSKYLPPAVDPPSPLLQLLPRSGISLVDGVTIGFISARHPGV